MRVGFIGLGAMGRPMASRLLAAGHELAVWARRSQSAAALQAEGATFCATPAELAARSEVVFTIITTGRDVSEVVLGPRGLRAGFAPDSVLVDMSTIAPGEARTIAAALGEAGVHMLDAPVSGGAVGAQAGSLAIMAGGEAGILERVRPLLEVFGKTIVHVGPSGAGQVAKACNQMLMVAVIEANAEALRLVAASGVDVAQARQAMLTGSAASKVLDVFGGRMVERQFAAGVEARLHHKDYAIIINEAQALGLSLPLAGAVMQQLNATMARGFGRDDTSSLLRVLEGHSG